MEISFQSKIVTNDQVLIKQIGESYVLLNLETESYYGLDQIGYDFYQKLINCSNIQSAFEEICSDYDADNAQIKSDLVELITKLSDEKIISINAA